MVSVWRTTTAFLFMYISPPIWVRSHKENVKSTKRDIVSPNDPFYPFRSYIHRLS